MYSFVYQRIHNQLEILNNRFRGGHRVSQKVKQPKRKQWLTAEILQRGINDSCGKLGRILGISWIVCREFLLIYLGRRVRQPLTLLTDEETKFHDSTDWEQQINQYQSDNKFNQTIVLTRKQTATVTNKNVSFVNIKQSTLSIRILIRRLHVHGMIKKKKRERKHSMLRWKSRTVNTTPLVAFSNRFAFHSER